MVHVCYENPMTVVYLFIFVVNSCRKQQTATSIVIFQVVVVTQRYSYCAWHTQLCGRWSSCLPANIRSASVSLQTFARRLKTYLFELPRAQLRTVYFAL